MAMMPNRKASRVVAKGMNAMPAIARRRTGRARAAKMRTVARVVETSCMGSRVMTAMSPREAPLPAASSGAIYHPYRSSQAAQTPSRAHRPSTTWI